MTTEIPIYNNVQGGKPMLKICSIKHYSDIKRTNNPRQQLFEILQKDKLMVKHLDHFTHLIRQHPALVSATDAFHNNTLLHEAAAHGHHHVVRFLIDETKADIEARNNVGDTPLQIAASTGHIRPIILLEKAGAAINARDSVGNTPLHRAVAKNHLKIIKRLIRHDKTLINAETMSGITPLHRAAVQGNETVITYLLNAGADVTMRTKTGFTPAMVALSWGHTQLGATLKRL